MIRNQAVIGSNPIDGFLGSVQVSMNTNERAFQIYQYVCWSEVHTLKELIEEYNPKAFWFYIPDVSKITCVVQVREPVADIWGHLRCNIDDAAVSLKSLRFFEGEINPQAVLCYRCRVSLEFYEYAKNHIQDIVSLGAEIGKLEGLCVIDPNSFEEFLQKNCPILNSLAYTYALLKELEDITSKKR